MIGDKVKLLLDTHVPYFSRDTTWKEALAEVIRLQGMLTKIRSTACSRGRTNKSDVEILHEIVSLIDGEEGP